MDNTTEPNPSFGQYLITELKKTEAGVIASLFLQMLLYSLLGYAFSIKTTFTAIALTTLSIYAVTAPMLGIWELSFRKYSIPMLALLVVTVLGAIMGGFYTKGWRGGITQALPLVLVLPSLGIAWVGHHIRRWIKGRKKP